MLFDEAEGMKGAGRRCVNKGRAALYAMVRRCHELDIHNVHIKCHLFNSLVKPILFYGSEIWGPALLAKGACLTDTSLSGDSEVIHKGFLRQCMSLRKSVVEYVLMSELHREPLFLSLFQLFLRFWNRIYLRPDSDLVKMAMQESCDVAKAGISFCWAGFLSSILKNLGIDLFCDPIKSSLDVEVILSSARDQWLSKISRDLATYSSVGMRCS